MKKYSQFLWCETSTLAGAAKFCNCPLARDTDLTILARELAIVSPLLLVQIPVPEVRGKQSNNRLVDLFHFFRCNGIP